MRGETYTRKSRLVLILLVIVFSFSFFFFVFEPITMRGNKKPKQIRITFDPAFDTQVKTAPVE